MLGGPCEVPQSRLALLPQLRRRMTADLTRCVLASGLAREISTYGPLVVMVILAITALFLALTLAAERMVETFLLWALFIVPFNAVVPALHPESQNYTAYYGVALLVFAAITLLRRRY